eukprot:gene2048-2738_t
MDFNYAIFKDDANFFVNQYMFRKVKINFLLVGHTHENIDQMFSRFSIRLRRKQAWTLDEMMQIAHECFTDGGTCEHTEKIYDFGSWMSGHDIGCQRSLEAASFQVFQGR